MNKNEASRRAPGVLLINMGGPESAGQVRPFLRRLFDDRHILDLPTPWRQVLSRVIVAARGGQSLKHYAAIGFSPLKRWTARQAQAVEALLQATHPGLEVRAAYSYSAPTIAEALADWAAPPRRVIALPLYPHDSRATLDSVHHDLERARARLNLEQLIVLPPFFEHPGYIDCTLALLRPALDALDPARPGHLVFSAHSLPQSLVDRGDPYPGQVARTVELLRQRLALPPHTLAFQSRVGPKKWLGPSTLDTVRALGAQGLEQLVVAPLGFVCDHLETLYELDLELFAAARQAGIKRFIRAPVFNDREDFIRFLATYVQEGLS